MCSVEISCLLNTSWAKIIENFAFELLQFEEKYAFLDSFDVLEDYFAITRILLKVTLLIKLN